MTVSGEVDILSFHGAPVAALAFALVGRGRAGSPSRAPSLP